ncbi:hypothetical protein WICMUC_004302 [Wickerhamomyces mucosus]|uniref:Fe2OG dioxygenase domain-containing protein n=1 Tax=Wickerhamomyces mucosus TaxID=1378264 RepID=A0A9P8TAV9_9ASCO|nr:hypothetical protein WICMUC_004302 [Wickerhamomyces mucosus]
MTDSKLKELELIFPEVDKSALLEILISCEGSVSKSESLLIEQFPTVKKRKLNASLQSNIQSLLKNEQSKGLVSTNTTNSNKPVYLYTKKDVENTCSYATIHYNFLPPDLADNVLKFIINDKDGFSSQEFHLFGNKCKSNHCNKLYASKNYDGVYYNGKKSKYKSNFNDDLKIVQVLIEDFVNKLIAERPRLPFQHITKWKGDIALCNRYDTKANDLDWHSDRMTYIGPHCTIASLSLGANREFRIRKMYNSTGSKFNTIYSIPLPHNTLFIMHPGFQEEFKHCVSSSTTLKNHEISNSTRINLTYRNYLSIFDKYLPHCPKCNAQMDLRRSYKLPQSRGNYIWLCTGGYLNKECNGFYWADFSKLGVDSTELSNDEKIKLYTTDSKTASLWIAKDDHEALKHFREKIRLQLRKSN